MAICCDVLWRAIQDLQVIDSCYRSLISTGASRLRHPCAPRRPWGFMCLFFVWILSVARRVLVPWTDGWLPWKRQNYMGKAIHFHPAGHYPVDTSCLQIYECKTLFHNFDDQPLFASCVSLGGPLVHGRAAASFILGMAWMEMPWEGWV